MATELHRDILWGDATVTDLDRGGGYMCLSKLIEHQNS